jgi:hypothetical protein
MIDKKLDEALKKVLTENKLKISYEYPQFSILGVEMEGSTYEIRISRVRESFDGKNKLADLIKTGLKAKKLPVKEKSVFVYIEANKDLIELKISKNQVQASVNQEQVVAKLK